MPATSIACEQVKLSEGSESVTSKDLKVDTARPSDRKFIVYTGYLHNQYTPPGHGAVRGFLVSPLTFLWTTLPANLGREHQALRFLNNLIAGAVPADSSDIVYPLNDGISPIASGLLLSDEFVAQGVLKNTDTLDGVGGHSGAKTARVFDNTDHLDFIQLHRPIGLSDDVTDVLCRNEKPRPIFAWILKDLLDQ